MEMPSSLITLFVLVSSCFPASSHDVPAVFVFGDSIFDVGNNRFNRNCTAQADFPPYGSSFFHHPTGSFTNGRTVADFISQFLGIEFRKPCMEAQSAVINGSERNNPSNGIDFASAGSGVLRDTNKDMVKKTCPDFIRSDANPGSATTIRALVEQNKVDKKLVRQSIFFLESSSNDVFDYFLPFDTPTLGPDACVQAMLTEVARIIGEIYKLGARGIAVFSLGPVGCVPAQALLPGVPVGRCYGKMNSMVEKYNRGLGSLARDVPIKYPGALCVYGTVYDIVQRIRAIPVRYGLSDVSSTCCGGGTLGGMLQCGKEGYKICSDPKRFLFWDYFHLSEHTNHLISKALWGGKRSRIRPMNLNTLANVSVSRPTSLKNITRWTSHEHPVSLQTYVMPLPAFLYVDEDFDKE